MNLTAAIGSLSAKACNVTTTTSATRIDRLRACIVGPYLGLVFLGILLDTLL